LLAITLPDAIILLEFNVILPAPVIPTLPVDESVPAPAPTAINVFAIKLPLAITFVELILTAPAAVIFKLPVDVNVADVAVGETKLLAIILPVTFKLPTTYTQIKEYIKYKMIFGLLLNITK
jgi:hypothetical protein